MCLTLLWQIWFSLQFFPARSRLPRKCDGIPISFTLGHHGPGHPRNLVGERDGGNLGRAPAQQRREPPAMPDVSIGPQKS
jgi:hypothetical protein